MGIFQPRPLTQLNIFVVGKQPLYDWKSAIPVLGFATSPEFSDNVRRFFMRHL
jgi:hypothetical protein